MLGLVAEGLTNREIAQTLFVTEKTAGAHVSSILAKLRVRSRLEAATAAQRLGLSVKTGIARAPIWEVSQCAGRGRG